MNIQTALNLAVDMLQDLNQSIATLDANICSNSDLICQFLSDFA